MGAAESWGGGAVSITRQQRQLHAASVKALERGMTRTEAFYAIAEERRVRAGTVAAAYWQVEREAFNLARAGGPAKQLRLEGAE